MTHQELMELLRIAGSGTTDEQRRRFDRELAADMRRPQRLDDVEVDKALEAEMRRQREADAARERDAEKTAQKRAELDAFALRQRPLVRAIVAAREAADEYERNRKGKG